MDQKKPVRLDIEHPGGTRVLEVEPGPKSLADVLGEHGLPLNTRCGQEGLCDGCEVELLGGILLDRLTHRAASIHSGNCVQACQCVVGAGPVQIRVPPRSLLSHKASALVDFNLNVSAGHDPLWQGASELMGAALGLAIDIGTTTVAVMLVDLTEDRVLARASDFNRQMRLGDDVVTRISLCANDKGMLPFLQKAIVDTIVPLVREVLKAAGAEARQLVCGAVAGNTTMLHLLAGIDPTPMGMAPFTPVFLEHRVLQARELPGWPEEMGLELHFLPGASAYIGADLTAGCLASGLAYDHGPSLLVDAGTNGEIILKLGVKFYGCATAAGPAFEGAGLSCGMRAAAGAISHLRWRGGKFEADVLGGEGAAPLGLCGSAYVDFLAEARLAGLMSATGRFERATTSVVEGRFGRALVVGKGPAGDVVVSEADVSRLLTAKAAIAAGILTLLAQEKLDPAQIKRLYLAGGFGTQIRPQSAIASGLLPGFRVDQIEPVGNSALGGAYLSLVDRRAMEEVRRVAKKVEVVELNLDPAFEATFIEQLALP